MSLSSQVAYLGLGSNLGDRRAWLTAARERIGKLPQTAVDAVSPLYESRPSGGPAGQGNYLNSVMRLVTAQAPVSLLRACLAIELELGRQRGERWAARTLDIDLLLFGELVVSEPHLVLPHPRLAERPFVLFPLRDIAPDLKVPGGGKTVASLAAAYRAEDAWCLADPW